MKKFFVIALAALMALAFAVPAMADGPIIKIGAKVLVDAGYRSLGKELTKNGEDDVTNVFIDIPVHTRLNFRFLSPDKSTGAFVELGLGSNAHGAFGGVNVAMRYVYGWYTVGNCTLLAGHLSNWFGSPAYAPLQGQPFGLSEGAHLYMFGWGHLWGQRLPQVAVKWEEGPWGVYFALEEPQNRANPFGTMAAVDTYEYFPRVTLAGKYRTKAFDTMPAINFTYHQAEGTASGQDDNYYTWAVILPWKIGLGAFTIIGQAHYGENFANEYAFYPTNSGVFQKSDGTFDGTTTLGGHVGFIYKFGAASLAAGLGGEWFNNDGWKSDGGYKDDNYNRWGCYVSVPYSVNKYFNVIPGFAWFDHGTDPVDSKDAGTEWILGLEFQFSF